MGDQWEVFGPRPAAGARRGPLRGPRQTREMLSRYFSRPDVRAQMRPDVPLDLLPCALMSAVVGEQIMNFMRPHHAVDPGKAKRDLEGRLALFYHGILLPAQA